MRYFLGILVMLVCACTSQEEVTHQASVNIDLSAVPMLLEAIDVLADNELDVAGLLSMTNSVTMDEEKQQKFALTFKGEDTELLYHVWREQVDWVHLYF